MCLFRLDISTTVCLKWKFYFSCFISKPNNYYSFRDTMTDKILGKKVCKHGFTPIWWYVPIYPHWLQAYLYWCNCHYNHVRIYTGIFCHSKQAFYLINNQIKKVQFNFYWTIWYHKSIFKSFSTVVATTYPPLYECSWLK